LLVLVAVVGSHQKLSSSKSFQIVQYSMLDSTQVSLVNFASLMRFFQFVTYGRFFSSIFVCSLHQRARWQRGRR